VDPAQFDDKMWSSVFWEPLNARPDEITKEFNKYFTINESDSSVHWSKSDQISISASLGFDFLDKLFGISASGSGSTKTCTTLDKFRHMLTENNIESDIEGDKFIPKKLDLVRLNMNDLTRNDTVISKVVRVRQVDIGGALQVAVGNSTLGEMDDENRMLRKKLTDFEAKQMAMQLEMQANKLEMQQNIQSMEQRLTNALRQSNETNSKKYDILISRLAHSASSNPSGTCSTHSTAENQGANEFIAFLDRHDIRCPDGKVLTRVHLVRSGDKVRYDFTCCSVI